MVTFQWLSAITFEYLYDKSLLYNNDLTPALFREEVQTNGHYAVIKLGKLVIVVFSVFNVNMTEHPGGLITSGMPIPAKSIYAPAFNTTSNQYRIRVDTYGNLYILSQGGAYINSDAPFISGELIYTTI